MKIRYCGSSTTSGCTTTREDDVVLIGGGVEVGEMIRRGREGGEEGEEEDSPSDVEANLNPSSVSLDDRVGDERGFLDITIPVMFNRLSRSAGSKNGSLAALDLAPMKPPPSPWSVTSDVGVDVVGEVIVDDELGVVEDEDETTRCGGIRGGKRSDFSSIISSDSSSSSVESSEVIIGPKGGEATPAESSSLTSSFPLPSSSPSSSSKYDSTGGSLIVSVKPNSYSFDPI